MTSRELTTFTETPWLWFSRNSLEFSRVVLGSSVPQMGSPSRSITQSSHHSATHGECCDFCSADSSDRFPCSLLDRAGCWRTRSRRTKWPWHPDQTFRRPYSFSLHLWCDRAACSVSMTRMQRGLPGCTLKMDCFYCFVCVLRVHVWAMFSKESFRLLYLLSFPSPLGKLDFVNTHVMSGFITSWIRFY